MSCRFLSRGFSWPRDWTCFSISCIGSHVLYCWANREADHPLWFHKILDHKGKGLLQHQPWTNSVFGDLSIEVAMCASGTWASAQAPLTQNILSVFVFTTTWYHVVVVQSCPTLCDPMDFSTPGFPVFHYLLSLLKLMSIEMVMPLYHLILCHPFLLLPSIFPSIKVFFQWVGSSHQVAKVLELQLQQQSFQWIFRAISFRIDWFDLLAV